MAQIENISFNLPHCGPDLGTRQIKIPINLGGQFATVEVNVLTITHYCFDKIHILGSK
jgi:hypothetical protein